MKFRKNKTYYSFQKESPNYNSDFDLVEVTFVRKYDTGYSVFALKTEMGLIREVVLADLNVYETEQLARLHVMIAKLHIDKSREKIERAERGLSERVVSEVHRSNRNWLKKVLKLN